MVQMWLYSFSRLIFTIGQLVLLPSSRNVKYKVKPLGIEMSHSHIRGHTKKMKCVAPSIHEVYTEVLYAQIKRRGEPGYEAMHGCSVSLATCANAHEAVGPRQQLI